MNSTQVILVVFITIIVMLAIWNLVLAIQNIRINKYKDKEIEKKKDYYGRFK